MMCTYLALTEDVAGVVAARGEPMRFSSAVVSFEHVRDLAVEHALCVDLRADSGDPSARVEIQMDPGPARRLAEAILAAIDTHESRPAG